MKKSIETVRPQLALVLDMEPHDIYPYTNLKENEKWDSFAILAAVALVTKETGKQVTVEDMKNIKVVNDLVLLLVE